MPNINEKIFNGQDLKITENRIEHILMNSLYLYKDAGLLSQEDIKELYCLVKNKIKARKALNSLIKPV